MQIDMGSHVRTNEGKDAGKIKRIVFDGDSMTVRQIIVDEGIFFAEERMVDIEYIDHIDDDHTVHLNINEAQVTDLTPFVHEQITTILTGDYYQAAGVQDVVIHPGSVPWDVLVLTHGTDVYDNVDKHIGHLDEIVYEDDGHASCFIVDSGFIFTHDVKVPITAVKSMSNDRIVLNISADEAEEASR